MTKLGSVHKSKLAYRDHTKEVGSFEVYNGAITSLSIAGFLTNFGSLQTATDAITLGVRASQSWTGDLTTVNNGFPTEPAAQRENGLEVTYMDDVTEQTYTLTIPTIDFDVLVFVPNGGDQVLFAGADASTEIKAWVTAFEAMARNKDSDQNTQTVVAMRYTGRNS